MTDYLSEFDGLTYNEEEKCGIKFVHLTNLKNLNGMQVAELLTYLYDDGYTHKCGMFADECNGALTVST